MVYTGDLTGAQVRLDRELWPAVAPNGDVYFALLDRFISIGGLQNQWIYRSTNGGATWVKRTNIGSS